MPAMDRVILLRAAIVNWLPRRNKGKMACDRQFLAVHNSLDSPYALWLNPFLLELRWHGRNSFDICDTHVTFYPASRSAPFLLQVKWPVVGRSF
jgi:hypothetical protein